MKVVISGLSNDAYTQLIELYGNMIFKSVKYRENEGTYYVVLDNYVIIKTGINEVKIDLGARCYYLSRQDFNTIEVY